MKTPKEVERILKILEKKGFEAFVVGGCVRDILRKLIPHDWDIATNAKPEEIEKSFPKTFYENKFGTVTVLTNSKKESLKAIEITPYRIDEKYSDKRHPDVIKWAKTIEQDLARRDFTVNAIALREKVIDPFSGRKDLEKKLIRAVGNAESRFSEDALRMMRAVRFAVSLNNGLWEIEKKTKQAIKKNSRLLELISEERKRDELVKIIMSKNGAKGIELLRSLNLLKYIVPELEQGFGIKQNKHHIYQVYQHNVLSLNYACQKGFPLSVRIAALLHDIGKPKTKRGEGLNSTFYNHEMVGAKMTEKILKRLCFPKKEVEKIVKLVRYHLFYYNVDEVGESSVRRLLRKVEKENIEELLQLRYADRIGSGVPKAEPYKLRHLKYLFEKVAKDPVSAKMLKISGNDIMKLLSIKPGPKVGQVLSYLLSYVLSDPKRNKKELLKEKVKELGKLSEKELEKLARQAKKEIDQVIQKEDKMTKAKYWVS